MKNVSGYRKIYLRQDGICPLCGEKMAWSLNDVSRDHIKPASMGGVRDSENIRLVHHICNLVRGNSTEERSQQFYKEARTAWLSGDEQQKRNWHRKKLLGVLK